MNAQQRRMALVAAMVSAGWCSMAFADVAVTLNATPPAELFADRNSGWRFTVNQEITITHLGVLDLDDPGLSQSHGVGLWRNPRAGGFEFVRSVEISGEDGELIDNYRYIPIDPPITLLPDTEPPSPGGDGYLYIDRYVLGVWSPPDSTDRILITDPSGLSVSDTISLNEASPSGFPPYFTAQVWTRQTEPPYSGLLPPWGQVHKTGHFGVNFVFTTATNQLPIALDDTASTVVNSPVVIDVLGNDSDPDDDLLSIDSYTQATNGSVVADDGSLTYLPNANTVGTDSFMYMVSDGNGGTATAAVMVTINPGTILIDVRPGSYPNSINLGSRGLVPVAILSTSSFDATMISPDTVFLAGAGVAVRGKRNRRLAACEDVDGDGLLDQVFKVETADLDPGTFQDGLAILRVHQDSDQASPVLYEGQDEITVVPPK